MVNFGRKQKDDLKNFVPEGHPIVLLCHVLLHISLDSTNGGESKVGGKFGAQ